MVASWSVRDRSAAKPSLKAVKASWRTTTWVEQELHSPATAEFVRAMLVQLTPGLGDVLTVRFKADPYDEAFQWFISRGKLSEYDFFRVLLSHPDVRRTLYRRNGEPTRPFKLQPGLLDPEEISPLELQKNLAYILVNGTAYANDRTRPSNPEQISSQTVSELLQGRPDDFVIYRTIEQWCRWFCGIDMNWTFFLFDMAMAEITFLWVTDED